MNSSFIFQPAAKLEFVRCYCSPANGWLVFVDIDPSEEGKTGGERKSPDARRRQHAMVEGAEKARREFAKIGIAIGGERRSWFAAHDLPSIDGDRDIVAFQKSTNRCVIAEVEADSSGQPEQKVYKAVGQIVVAGTVILPPTWALIRVVVVTGEKMRAVLKNCAELEKLGVFGLALSTKPSETEWLFGGQGLKLENTQK